MFKSLTKINPANLSLQKEAFKRTAGLISKSYRFIGHIRNVLDEQRKIEVQKLHELPMLEKTDRVYKPSYTIEFDRAGEVLVFSSNPFQDMTVYLKYPYVLYESFIPLSFFMWCMNPLDIPWYFNHINLAIMYYAWVPRMWYFRSLQYRPVKMHLIRGGKFLKIETHTLAGDINFAWVENYNFNPLSEDQKKFDDRDNAEFLTEEGQLKYDLACQLDNFTEFGCNQQDIMIYFLKSGTVHHPELFEAAIKGYNIDTSNFVINTAHNVRAKEGSTNF
jgi:hypothetical protein